VSPAIASCWRADDGQLVVARRTDGV
jgi:hypothetical protein